MACELHGCDSNLLITRDGLKENGNGKNKIYSFYDSLFTGKYELYNGSKQVWQTNGQARKQ